MRDQQVLTKSELWHTSVGCLQCLSENVFNWLLFTNSYTYGSQSLNHPAAESTCLVIYFHIDARKTS